MLGCPASSDVGVDDSNKPVGQLSGRALCMSWGTPEFDPRSGLSVLFLHGTIAGLGWT